MARTTKEIQQEIIVAVQADPVLSTRLTSTSSAAVWRLWSRIIAAMISIAEGIMDNDKTEIQTIVQNSRIGTGIWYVQLAKQFQWNESETYYLVVNTDTGVISYNKVVPADRIITQAAYVESNGRIILKIAAGSSGNLHPLTSQQQVNFEDYMRQLKIAGIIVEVVNLPADLLEISCDVYYSPAYNINQVQEAIICALDQYSVELNYNGVIYKNAVIDAIQQVPGVVDVQINSLYGIQGENRSEILRAYTTYAGYFNIKKDNVFPTINLMSNDDNI